MISKRLLKQFFIPEHDKTPYLCSWHRSSDLFGDYFELTAHVHDNGIIFSYTHAQKNKKNVEVWHFEISVVNNRAKIINSTNISPQLKTIYRAVEMISNTQNQLQANPTIKQTTHSPNTLTSPALSLPITQQEKVLRTSVNTRM